VTEERPAKGLKGFVRELRRRRVFRVAVVYAAGVFAVLQVADIVFPAMGIAEAYIRVLVLFSLMGFPITMVVAWVYDLTPAGIIRTADADALEGETVDPWVPRTARIVLVVITGVLVSGAGYLSWRWAGETGGGSASPKSVAVLPFVDVNATDSTAFFTNGLHDDVISQLSKVGDLFVISRTSVMQYAGTPTPIPEIGRELGVRTVLEGSVRQAGGIVRVDTRLIDTQTDQTLWVESYERDRSDVFAIQSEIAQQIALALEAELSPEEAERIRSVPTENPAAYAAFQRGGLHMDRQENLDDALTGVGYFEEAVGLDPEFAAAHARLARARMWLYWKWPGYGDQLPLAVEALDRAVELAPGEAETQLAQGYFHLYGRGDLDRALEHFRLARQLRPGDAEAMAAVGLVLRRKGDWEAAVGALEDAMAQDPRSYTLTVTMAETLTRMRRFDEAEAYLDQAIALAPALRAPYRDKILLQVTARGDTAAARATLEGYAAALDPDVTLELEGILAYYRGDLEAAVDRLTRTNVRNHRVLGLAYHALGRLDLAVAQGDSLGMAATAALASLEESGIALQPGLQARAQSDLALAEALGGRRRRAFRAALAAVEILPLSVDAVDGADHLASLGLTLALLGEHDRALQRLDSALAVPSSLTRAELMMDPAYSSLRMLEGFQSVLAGGELSLTGVELGSARRTAPRS
jgi:TolB-like protein/Tfp pilus assembly protein PilF